jgi:hypothetical protein
MSFHYSSIEPDPAAAESATPVTASPPYTFRIYAARKQVCLTISGFWNADTLGDFSVALFGAIKALGCGPGEHTLCCDVSNAAIQPQDIVTGFQKLIAGGPTHARKLALWTSRPLSRMQSRRLLAVRDNIAVFDNEAAALSWLAD